VGYNPAYTGLPFYVTKAKILALPKGYPFYNPGMVFTVITAHPFDRLINAVLYNCFIPLFICVGIAVFLYFAMALARSAWLERRLPKSLRSKRILPASFPSQRFFYTNPYYFHKIRLTKPFFRVILSPWIGDTPFQVVPVGTNEFALQTLWQAPFSAPRFSPASPPSQP
jgi:hypothetical protein